MDTNTAAFLSVIRKCEGTDAAPNHGYNCLFGWTPKNNRVFTGYGDHPRKLFPFKVGGKTLKSSAAGAYQMLAGTYDSLHKRGFMKDFSPAEQDKGAMQLLRECGAAYDVAAGHLEEAAKKANRIWASLPGSPYGQPTHPMAEVKKWYLQAGGKIA